MKPPPRKRQKKELPKEPEPQSRRRPKTEWTEPEMRRLLTALNKLKPPKEVPRTRRGGRITVKEALKSARESNPNLSQRDPDLSQSNPNLTQRDPNLTQRDPDLRDPDLTQTQRDAQDLERVREYLPKRTVAEINSVLEALKDDVIRYAKNKYLRERTEERRTNKPLDLWLQQAFTLTEDAHESLSSAFTQMLHVSAVEPLTVSGSSSSSQSPAPPQNVKEELQRSSYTLSPDASTEVSFEKIYHYLSTLQQPRDLCPLSPMESAIVLDLLLSLPEELLLLDCDRLSKHLSEVYLDLCVASRKGSSPRRPLPPVAPEQHPAPESTQRRVHPPLNPFLIPVSLLSRKAPPTPAKQTRPLKRETKRF